MDNSSCYVYEATRVQFLPEAKTFLFSIMRRLALGPTQLPIQWQPEAISPRVKRPGSIADHPPSGEIKNGGAKSPLPHVFCGRVL
jgi:hypothetical protein